MKPVRNKMRENCIDAQKNADPDRLSLLLGRICNKTGKKLPADLPARRKTCNHSVRRTLPARQNT